MAVANRPIKTVAAFEAGKGILVLVAGCGLLSLAHQDIQATADRLIKHLHLNPAKHYPRIFLEAAMNLNEAKLRLIAILAASYATLRFFEAYGLWQGRRWAKWAAVVSAAIYLPFELAETVRTMSVMASTATVINIAVLGYLLAAIRKDSKSRSVAL